MNAENQLRKFWGARGPAPPPLNSTLIYVRHCVTSKQIKDDSVSHMNPTPPSITVQISQTLLLVLLVVV